MRKLILFMSMSLDGFIGGAGAAEEVIEDNVANELVQDDHLYANQLFAAADTVLFGRTTYEGFI